MEWNGKPGVLFSKVKWQICSIRYLWKMEMESDDPLTRIGVVCCCKSEFKKD